MSYEPARKFTLGDRVRFEGGSGRVVGYFYDALEDPVAYWVEDEPGKARVYPEGALEAESEGGADGYDTTA